MILFLFWYYENSKSINIVVVGGIAKPKKYYVARKILNYEIEYFFVRV